MAHSIVTVATMKGGSGKSTLASCLAVHWQLNGTRSAIIDADPARYRALAAAAGALAPRGNGSPDRADRRWRQIQRKGKWLSVARLAKASFTFSGGIDYLAWKINRHAGTDIEVKPWQRRWPLIGALILLPRLLARGEIR